ncbi:MAG: protease II [Candidatus Azotimanducaceae bacterium]
MLLVKARQPGHRYRLQLRQGELTILSNLNGDGYQVAVTQIAGNSFENVQWLSGIAGQILDFERSGQAVAIHRRQGMSEFISVINIESGKINDVASSEPGESLKLLPFDAWENEVRFRREGFSQPSQSFGFSIQSGLLRSIDPTAAPSGLGASGLVPAGLDTADYRAELRWITVRDGASVPVTIMYRKDREMTGSPLLVTTYGAYGISAAFRFEPRRFPLLDRGFVLAHIHVRGGGELGERWHRLGSRSNGMNSVTDFIDVTKQLVADGFGDGDRVYAQGASAGGAVIAAAINQKPALFQAVILRAAFFDIINTLASEDQDLTFSDHLEWGNPKIPEQFGWLASLSPYENISAQPYPDMLLLAASNDRRVGLHESLKYLARVRHLNTGQNLMLIDIDNNSGHLGVTDQYKKRRQVTLEQSFLLSRLQTIHP